MEGSVQDRAVFSEDGARLAVCSLDGEVKVWDSATGTLSTRFTPEGARGAAASWSRVSSDATRTLSECEPSLPVSPSLLPVHSQTQKGWQKDLAGCVQRS